jgi:fatty-acyl-CoA synthase
MRDPEYSGAGERLGAIEYEDFLDQGDPEFAWRLPGDEWDAIALNYTSGTTGDPKGVVYHHRGAYLLAIGNVLTCAMGRHPVYLWTVPMFHCNGWCFPWTVSMVAGTHVCLRRVRALVLQPSTPQGHPSDGAPIVMSTLLNAPNSRKKQLPGLSSFGGLPPHINARATTTAGFNSTISMGSPRPTGRPASMNGMISGTRCRRPRRRSTRRARACATRCSRGSTCSIPTPWSRSPATARRWAR